MDVRIDVYTVLAPTWNNPGPQVGAFWLFKSPKSGLQRLPRPTRELLPTQTPTMAQKVTSPTPQNDTLDSHFGSIGVNV